jgi:sulfur-oxidizing protein SoxZ
MPQKKGTIRMRARASGGVTTIQILINYKVDTGLVRDAKTNRLEVKKPQHFVKTVAVSLNDKPVMECNLSVGSSDDPFLSLKVKGGKPGDTVHVRWDDNGGDWDEFAQPISG